MNRYPVSDFYAHPFCWICPFSSCWPFACFAVRMKLVFAPLLAPVFTHSHIFLLWKIAKRFKLPSTFHVGITLVLLPPLKSFPRTWRCRVGFARTVILPLSQWFCLSRISNRSCNLLHSGIKLSARVRCSIVRNILNYSVRRFDRKKEKHKEKPSPKHKPLTKNNIKIITLQCRPVFETKTQTICSIA